MATLQQLSVSAAHPGCFEKFVQLADGRVLVCGQSGTIVLSPDEYGSFVNPTWGEYAPYPHFFYGAIAIVHRDGTVTKWGGHQQVQGDNAYGVSRYNPDTNTWTRIASKNDYAFSDQLEHGNGGSLIELDDGSIRRTNLRTRVLLNTDTLQLSSSEATVSWQAPQYNPSIPGFKPDVLGAVESSWVRLPTNEFVMFPNLTLGLDDPSRFPVHGFWLTSSPILHIPLDGSVITVYAVADPPFDTAWMHNGVFMSGGTRPVYPAMRQQKISWIHLHGESNVVSREQSSAIYMPKIDRVVLVGGTAGEVFAYDYVNKQMSIMGQMPQVEDLAALGSEQRLATQHVGVAPDVLLRGNTIEMVALSTFMPRLTFALTLSNGRWILVEAVGGLSGLTGGGVAAGNTFRYVGPFRVISGENPLTTSAVTQSTVYSRNVTTSVAENFQLILPNGNLLVPVGSGESLGTNATKYLAEWDGSNWKLHDFMVDTRFSVGGNFEQAALPLPSGEILFSDGDLVAVMSVDGPPDSTARPIINAVPSVLFSAQTYTLSGRQLHGRHQGVSYGDDVSTNCNIPIVSLTSHDTSRVYYCRSSQWTSASIAPFHPSTVNFTVPASVPSGAYSLKVHSAGNISEPVYVRVETFAVGPIQTMLAYPKG
jgi:hypothetical protein